MLVFFADFFFLDSPIKGPAGNVEFVVYAVKGGTPQEKQEQEQTEEEEGSGGSGDAP